MDKIETSNCGLARSYVTKGSFVYYLNKAKKKIKTQISALFNAFSSFVGFGKLATH